MKRCWWSGSMLADSKTVSTVWNRNLFSREGHLTERDQREDSAQDISASYRNVSRIEQTDETSENVYRTKHSRILSISWRFSLVSRTKQKLRYRRWSRGSSVDIGTRYELDSPGIESRWRQDFPHPSRPALRSTQPPIQCVPGLSPG